MEEIDFGIKFTITDAVAHEDTVLTFEKLTKVMIGVKRKHFIYVMSSTMIPDDAYGVLFVRKEDAKVWSKKVNND